MHRPRRTRHAAAHRAGRDALTIAAAAPQVISMRLARMAAHGFHPSASDRRELHRMSAEKLSAFSESWAAMGMQAMRMQQAFWQNWFSMLMRAPLSFKPWSGPDTAHVASTRAAKAMASSLAQMTAVGLAPVSRRVAGNVKRLGRARAVRGRK